MRLKQNDRGTLLIVAMLVILVLAGLALIGVRNVILESRQVGNFRASEQSLHVTESGQSSVIAIAVEKGDSFPVFIQANNFTILSDNNELFRVMVPPDKRLPAEVQLGIKVVVKAVQGQDGLWYLDKFQKVETLPEPSRR